MIYIQNVYGLFDRTKKTCNFFLVVSILPNEKTPQV